MSWGGLWGGAWGTSEQSLAKEDTRLLLLDSVTVDNSQYDTDLTAAAGGGYEANSARGAITGETGREIYVRWFHDEDPSVVICAHAATDLSGYTWAILTTAGGQIVFGTGGVTIWTAPASVGTGHLSVGWSTRPNPDTTGASDALISEILIYTHDTNEYLASTQVTHAIPATSNTWSLAVGGYHDGSTVALPPSYPVTKFRLSNAWHPNTEFAEDWTTERTAYAGTLDDGIVEPLPLTVASGVGDSAEWVGRANAGFAAAHSKAVQRRAWSPLVNEAYRRPVPLASTTGYAARYLLTAPGAASHQLGLHWLRWVEVPPGATHAWVRVQVQTWVTSGSAVPWSFRCYALNRPPTVASIQGQQNLPVPALEVAYVEATLTTDHTSTGVGEWLDLGLLRLPRFTGKHVGWSDTVHLCLAYAIDPASASSNDSAARAYINAWHARPVEKWTPGGLHGG